MNIEFKRPPNFAEIDAVFNIANKPVIFAYGTTIFNPHRIEISPSLRAHEEVHGRRQGGDVGGWWKAYLGNPEFRLAEELPAHQAEYRVYCETHIGGPARNTRRLFLHEIAKRLSSDLYGRLIRYDDARRLIKECA